MDIRTTTIPECYEITPKVFQDARGKFIKTFHQHIFEDHQLDTNFSEEYYSVSCQNVLRGLHFQLPPMDHTKIVYCVLGEVIDVIVDLRVGSPTYGKYEMFELSADKANMIYIPNGLAHGFYVISQTAILIYKVSTVYDSELDAGIHWNSAGIPWPFQSPITSGRDEQLQSFSDFESPFIYT